MLPINTLRRFAHDGRLFRCFGHVLAAHHGSLLAVPLLACCGDFRQLIDGCPVSHIEALAVIDGQGADAFPIDTQRVIYGHALQKLEVIDGIWNARKIEIWPGQPGLLLLISANGAKYGIAPVFAAAQRWEALAA